MPADHLSQWKHNRVLISKIPSTHPDWIVTVAFYSALQAIDAMLLLAGTQIRNHDQRNAILSTTHIYSHIWQKYSVLYDMARKVRYLTDPSIWLPIEKVSEKVIGAYQYPIEASVLKHMKLDIEFPRVTLSA